MNNILISETGEKNLNFGLGALTTEVNFTPVGIIQDVHAANLRHPQSPRSLRPVYRHIAVRIFCQTCAPLHFTRISDRLVDDARLAGKLRIPDRNPDTTIRSDRYHRFNQYAECRRLASSPSRCR